MIIVWYLTGKFDFANKSPYFYTFYYAYYMYAYAKCCIKNGEHRIPLSTVALKTGHLSYWTQIIKILIEGTINNYYTCSCFVDVS